MTSEEITPPDDPAEAPSADPQDGASAPADGVPVPARSRRRVRLRDIADDALRGRGHLMSADPARARIRATFSGNSIGDDRVDAETFGQSVSKLSRLFTALTGSRPQVFAMAFGNSVTIEIGAPEDEVERAAKALAAAEAEDDEKKRERLVAQAVPETTLAGYAALDLLRESEDDVVGAALTYGTQVTDAFKALVRSLADDDLSMKLALPSAQDLTGESADVSIELERETAQDYKAALTAAGDDETLKISAVGVLSMADSGSRMIRLTLDNEAAKDPALKGRRTITARYTGPAHRQIRDGGLWDQNVIADFEMTRDRRGTTAHVRRPTFTLISTKPRYQ